MRVVLEKRQPQRGLGLLGKIIFTYFTRYSRQYRAELPIAVRARDMKRERGTMKH